MLLQHYCLERSFSHLSSSSFLTFILHFNLLLLLRAHSFANKWILNKRILWGGIENLRGWMFSFLFFFVYLTLLLARSSARFVVGFRGFFCDRIPFLAPTYNTLKKKKQRRNKKKQSKKIRWGTYQICFPV